MRQPSVAGLFYPAGAAECQAAARDLAGNSIGLPQSQRRLFGALVPHAGWTCSGPIAGEAIGTLAAGARADLVVVFGAVHTPIDIGLAALDADARWRSPVAEAEVADDCRRRLNSSKLFVVDPRLHRQEHAVEVELPLIQSVWPAARLLPIEVPLVNEGAEIGRRTADAVLGRGEAVVFLASSDLTHYGPAYRFAPAGVGLKGLRWAKDNDHRLLALLSGMESERVVPEVRAHQNACGGGAIAAMLAACSSAGATAGRMLRHANSVEMLGAFSPRPSVDAVGYAGMVFE